MTAEEEEPNSSSEEVKKEFLRLRYRILTCTAFYKSKEDAELDLQRVEAKYANCNINHYGNIISAIVESDSLRRDINRMVDTKCLTCNKPIVVNQL
jgi:hypothetical protein